MTRRIVETKAKSIDNELLMVISIYEEGIEKEQVKKENPYSKRHGVLFMRQGAYELKGFVG